MSEPSIEPPGRGYNTLCVAMFCAISPCQARRICRAVLGARTRYRLTEEELQRVKAWHERNHRDTRRQNQMRVSPDLTTQPLDSA